MGGAKFFIVNLWFLLSPFLFAVYLTLGAHAREGYGSRRVCLSVCLSVCLFVCPSVPALAASASV